MGSDKINHVNNELRKLTARMDSADIMSRVRFSSEDEKFKELIRVVSSLVSKVNAQEKKHDALLALMVKHTKVTVREHDDLADQLAGFRRKASDERIEQGDIAWFNIDQAFDDGTQAAPPLREFVYRVGSNIFIPGVDSNLVGMLAENDTKTFDVTYPENYDNDPKLSNKTVKWTVSTVMTKVRRDAAEGVSQAVSAQAEGDGGVSESGQESRVV